MKGLSSILKRGKQRPPPEEDERRSLKDSDQLEYAGASSSPGGSIQALDMRANSDPDLALQDDQEQTMFSAFDEANSDGVPYSIRDPVIVKKWGQNGRESDLLASKPQDFQVCITIIEARHLAGLDIDPVVFVQIADQKKSTSVKESTNSPYFDEYFVFDFQMAPMMFYDKIISLTVLHSRNSIRSGKVIGSFKMDIGTIFSESDRRFYHKWALLTDPDDITAGPKGYLKCDISVVRKGDTVKPPPKTEKDEDDIEANLLLPTGVPAERQHARFIVEIYRADGLPRMDAGIVSNVKKAFTGEAKDLVDPYVQVTFAGQTGKTSVKKNTSCPTWNEQIVFTEMFPPLCQRIKFQLKDDDTTNDSVIGTHFMELSKISNDGEKGFLPTFGPSFIFLYGSPRDYSLSDEHTKLNEGLGEGVMYRGKLVVALRTEILDTIDAAPPRVEVMEMVNLTSEDSHGRNDEFFLFSCILEATMIDKKVGEKPVYFEITVGNAGNVLDGCRSSNKGDENDIESGSDSSIPIQSTTPPVKPANNDRQYNHIPFGDKKPCMWVRSIWQDHRRRLYSSNILATIADKLEGGLSDVQEMIDQERPYSERRLRGVLEELYFGCNRFLTISKRAGASTPVETKLDKERKNLCQTEMDHIASQTKTMMAHVSKSTIREQLRTTQGFLKKIRSLIEDPQHSLPDVFVWMISNGKRIAYERIPARDLIFSNVGEETGRYCGKVQTLFLKRPGKKGAGPGGWTIQAKLHIYMWLGLTRHKENFLKGLPKGYDSSDEIRNADNLQSAPPSYISYSEKQLFELRCHMYQARSLIKADSSGQSDPFARVIFSDQSQTTQVIEETLNPTWDEMLLFNEVLVCGSKEDIKDDSPVVVVEIFDQDKVGKSEFIGRTIARPHVKFSDEPYSKPNFPPALEWHDIYRGSEQAGELLATFELLQLSGSDESSERPELPNPKENVWRADRGPILPVPASIRPTLSKYRIEVVFWGLRELKRVHLMTVDRPRVEVECAGQILQSSVIPNYKKNPNFSMPVKYLDVELPDQEMYCPPLTIRVMDCRSFGRFTLVGTHVIKSLQRYIIKPADENENKKLSRYSNQSTSLVQHDDVVINIEKDPSQTTSSTIIVLDFDGRLREDEKTATDKRNKLTDHGLLAEDEDNRDWWTRYFASYEEMIKGKSDAIDRCGTVTTGGRNGSVNGVILHANQGDELSVIDAKKMGEEIEKNENQQEHQLASDDSLSDNDHQNKAFRVTSTAIRAATRLSPGMQTKAMREESLITIYPCELENVPEFGGFHDWLNSFDLYRSKKTRNELEDENRSVGIFKGSLKIYKIFPPKSVPDPMLSISDSIGGSFQGLPSNDSVHVLVRVYVVKATELHPADQKGKADPYIVMNIGSKKVNDKENYISQQLNPVFGKCFEFKARFPQESSLSVQIYDWDLVGSDDLIGETKIDLENRFYSKHRPICGLPQKYETSGVNQWRDPLKPTQILSKLCKDLKVDGPEIMHNRIRIGDRVFTFQVKGEDDLDQPDKEHMALSILHQWHEIPRAGFKLVPEHIEIRPLYHPDKPGLEQGKLEMWVDIFPMDGPQPGPPIDISPRKPKSYELRVIIWNTDDVILEEDALITGEKMSDIFVKGWLKGPEDMQCTDVHYRSLTGEGNFNWRFVYPFDYLPAEEKIVISRKESLFSWDETECKIPARLELQVWDADHISSDDIIGAITLDLNRFPRGAKSSKQCTLDMLQSDSNVPMVPLFKQKRIKGWWPFFVKRDDGEMELTGKVEAELQLLTKGEAEKNPVGLGRNEPDPLDKPQRPDTSFVWFLSPLKSMRYILWRNYKWLILKILLFIALVLILVLFVYSLPGYTVKKMLGA